MKITFVLLGQFFCTAHPDLALETHILSTYFIAEIKLFAPF